MKQSDERNYFGEFVDDYADEIVSIQPEFYRNAALKIDKVLSNMGRCKVLDIGNGGVINYSFANLEELRCLDLEVSKKAKKKYATFSNISFTKGNVFDMKDIPDNYYDAIIIQTVIHHLAGNTPRESEQNVLEALRNCKQILKKDGKVLVVESVVKPWFDVVERTFYPLMQFFFKIVKFDRVYQFSKKRLYQLLAAEWKIEEFDDVGVDKYIWLLRKKVLTKITPCRAAWYLLSPKEELREE